MRTLLVWNETLLPSLLFAYIAYLHSRGHELTPLCFRIILLTMAPKSAKRNQEGERLEQSLRRMDKGESLALPHEGLAEAALCVSS